MPGSSGNTRPRSIDDPCVRPDSCGNAVEPPAGNRTVRTDPPGAALPDLFRKPATMAEAAAEPNRRTAGREACRVWVLPEPLPLEPGARCRLTRRRGGDCPRRFGDATLFRIAPSLAHRVRRVKDTAPKIAFAGWFTGHSDYRDVLRTFLQPARAGVS